MKTSDEKTRALLFQALRWVNFYANSIQQALLLESFAAIFQAQPYSCLRCGVQQYV
ncbi:hypothetical protein CEXT_262181, partial [Caerostris extrusa]